MKMTFDPDDLRPLVRLVVAEALEQAQAVRARLDGRLAFTESEAAALLGIKPNVLRDARYRGELRGSRAGKRIIYGRDDLLRWLEGQRVE